jgi:uncharacterized damage-inducible protein DinB
MSNYVSRMLALLGPRDPFEVLAETPQALERAVAGLGVEREALPEESGKWSVRQVVQHLSDSEVVGGFRFRMILAQDGPSIAGYDQDLWAERLRYQESAIAEALAEFTALRRINLRMLQRVDPAELERWGMHSERGKETLAHLLRLYAGHDLAHLAQIERIRRVVG